MTDQNIDMISFTGSSKVGKYLYEKAGKKFIKCLLELGGSAPGIIFSDCDFDKSVNSALDQRLFNSGQCCDGLKRLIVHKSIFDKVVKKLVEIAKSKRVGDALDEKTQIGPLVAKRQLNLALEQLEDALAKGAKIIQGGKKPSGLKGAYLEPTIVTGIKRNMRLWNEEVFAPILPVISFKDEKEAISLANDTMYGLGSYIFTKDKKKSMRVASALQTGMVSINGNNYVCPWNVFGGTKSSGMGREHGVHGLRELCQIKLIARDI